MNAADAMSANGKHMDTKDNITPLAINLPSHS